MNFHSPMVLVLLAGLPLLAYLCYRRKGSAAVRFSSVGVLRECGGFWRVRFRRLLWVVRFGCLAVLIIALARPQEGTTLSSRSTEGVAMEIVVDRSGSMQEKMVYDGEKLNRLEVSKLVLKDFIGGGDGFEGRAADMIGLVTFARYADTICPLVQGHTVLLEFLDKTELVTIRSEDGTAIGDAIARAAARLKTAEDEIVDRNKRLRVGGELAGEGVQDKFTIKSKVIILLTDGQNNHGANPLEAAALAKEWGIKIYTIGIESVTSREGLFGMLRGGGVDERLLRAIAENTGGFYGRAGSGGDLKKIYKEIDKLEKSEIKSVEYVEYAEQFGSWALAGLCLLGFEMFAGCTVFRKIP
jgi:Ca-activated chloride channel family protein